MDKSLRSTLVFNNVKTKTLATGIAVVSAVVLPQIFHLLGIVSGNGSAIGETLLPMHLAIFMVGLLAGSTAGMVSGAVSPLISFMLTGMPNFAVLPFMMIELLMYGLISGLLANKNMPVIVKLLIAQAGGRAVRAFALTVGFYLLGSQVDPMIALTSISKGLPGLVLQWVLIPLFVFYINKKAENE